MKRILSVSVPRLVDGWLKAQTITINTEPHTLVVGSDPQRDGIDLSRHI